MERQQLRQRAREQIQRAQSSYKKQFDNRRKREYGYPVGDLVAIRRTQLVSGRKLASEYLGPYVIKKVNRNGRYRVRKAADVEGPINTSKSCNKLLS